jgi:PIN domain nuclease of toxin-antitoxin system
MKHLDLEEAESCGALTALWSRLVLSLGDGVCLPTAAWLEVVAVTANREWQDLDGEVALSRMPRVELTR